MAIHEKLDPYELKYAYTAGIVDGEGCLTIIKKQPHGSEKTIQYVPLLKVSMRDSIIPNTLLTILGVGNVHKENNGVTFVYMCQGRPNLRIVLPRIIPYLNTKKPQATLLLEFLNQVTVGKRKRTHEKELETRDFYYQELKRLKKIAYGYEV